MFAIMKPKGFSDFVFLKVKMTQLLALWPFDILPTVVSTLVSYLLVANISSESLFSAQICRSKFDQEDLIPLSRVVNRGEG